MGEKHHLRPLPVKSLFPAEKAEGIVERRHLLVFLVVILGLVVSPAELQVLIQTQTTSPVDLVGWE